MFTVPALTCSLCVLLPLCFPPVTFSSGPCSDTVVRGLVRGRQAPWPAPSTPLSLQREFMKCFLLIMMFGEIFLVDNNIFFPCCFCFLFVMILNCLTRFYYGANFVNLQIMCNSNNFSKLESKLITAKNKLFGLY